MELKIIKKNNESILVVCPFGKNRSSSVLTWNKRVFEHFNIPINYLEFNFSAGLSHGSALDYIVNKTKDIVDYWIFIDSDLIPLRKDLIDIYYDKLKDKETIISTVGQSNHLKGPNGEYSHPYAYGSGLGISKELYLKLGSPSFNEDNIHSDTAEQITYAAERLGFNVCLIWPKSVVGLSDSQCEKLNMDKQYKKSKVGQFEFGYQTVYGNNLWFHCMVAPADDHEQKFIEKCQEVIGNQPKKEAVIVCVNRSAFLNLTLPLNKNKFDNIVVITDYLDIETEKTCLKHGIQCIKTGRFYENNAKFDKGSAINEGLKQLKYNQFVCHLDADIILPEEFNQLNLNNLDINIFYGARRYFIKNIKELDDLFSKKRELNSFSGLELGGWGCGFFQLWNMKSNKINGIPINDLYPSYPTASESDILMLKRFHPNVISVGKLNIDVLHLGLDGQTHTQSDQTNFFNENP